MVWHTPSCSERLRTDRCLIFTFGHTLVGRENFVRCRSSLVVASECPLSVLVSATTFFTCVTGHLFATLFCVTAKPKMAALWSPPASPRPVLCTRAASWCTLPTVLSLSFSQYTALVLASHVVVWRFKGSTTAKTSRPSAPVQ